MASPNIRMIVTSAQRLLRVGATSHLANLLKKQRPADIAAIFRKLGDANARVAFDSLVPVSTRLAMDAFAELEPGFAAGLLAGRSATETARLLRELAPDDMAALIEHLPPDMSSAVRDAMGQTGHGHDLLEYAEGTAGRIMTPNVFALGETVTAAEAVATLQRSEGPEVVFYLYVIDDRHHLVGVTSLRRLVLVPPDMPLARIMTSDVVSVPVDAKQEDVATLVASYNLLAIPVVDSENKLVGVITVDDVIDVIRDETTKDIQRLGGLEALDEPYTRTPFWTLVQKRGRWLVVLFLGEMLTATAMSHFEGEISRAVVLALFVPLIISSGGNSGSQAASLMIRALAVGEVTLGDWWAVMRKELRSGLALGSVLGFVGFLRVTLWANVGHMYGPHWFLIALTVAFSLVGVVMWGTLSGAMLPFVLKRLGADPATSSAPFVATLVDVTGLIIYFSVAALLLTGTLL